MKYRLREQMEKNKDTVRALADHLGIAYETLLNKINDRADFTRTEIKTIKARYHLSAEQIDFIFFS